MSDTPWSQPQNHSTREELFMSTTRSAGLLEGNLSQSLLLHLFPQAQRSHIGPDFFDISQAFFFCSRLAGIVPSQGILFVRRPNGILLFVIKDHLINCLIFGIHLSSIETVGTVPDSTHDIQIGALLKAKSRPFHLESPKCN